IVELLEREGRASPDAPPGREPGRPTSSPRPKQGGVGALPPRSWEPDNFRLEPTTVWSFPDRGRWATHDGRFRGNWSPYIPRNLIIRYTRPGDLVLDPFAGGGTTAIEAKLLGRRCIAGDINPVALTTARDHLAFPNPTLSASGHDTAGQD